MITHEVIEEIYKKYSKPPKKADDLRVPYFLSLLSKFHHIKVSATGEEIIVDDLDDINPFRVFLIKRLTGIIEFDRMVAFAFNNHIIFFQKDSPDMRVHFRPEKQSLFRKLFGK